MGNQKRDRVPKAELIQLSRYLRNTIERSGLTINEFAKQSGFSNSSTFYQIGDGLVKPGYDSVVLIVEGLWLLCGEKSSPDELMGLIDGAIKQPTVERKQPEILAGTAIVWHLQRIELSERLKVWPDILKVAAADFANSGLPQFDVAIGRKPAIDVLIGLINNKADQQNLGSLQEFVDWMFVDSESTERAELALKGLQTIFIEKRLPYQDSPEFGALLSKLANVLDYQSDIQLLTICSLTPQVSPKTVESKSQKSKSI